MINFSCPLVSYKGEILGLAGPLGIIIHPLLITIPRSPVQSSFITFPFTRNLPTFKGSKLIGAYHFLSDSANDRKPPNSICALFYRFKPLQPQHADSFKFDNFYFHFGMRVINTETPEAEATALYDFEATDPSHLALKTGDRLRIYIREETGWWSGLNDHGQSGWFPASVRFPDEMDSSIFQLFLCMRLFNGLLRVLCRTLYSTWN